MKVKKLDVGPILGQVTSTRAKIFGRGVPEFYDHQPKRAHLVLRWRESGRATWQPSLYFKLNPNFDMSAVAVIENLTANRSYEYQCGYIFSDVGSTKIDVESVLDWDEAPTYQFKTASANQNASRTIVTGSCRYILKLFGGNWFDDRGDKTFRSIMNEHGEERIFDLALMSGDQIYADDLNFIGADSSTDEFYRRYRLAFSQTHIRKMMANIPTLMTLDDHEIEDNWPEHASSKDMVTKYPVAMHAYQVYQTSHSPLTKVEDGRLSDTEGKYWYTHQDGCCDFFVTDSRTERDLDEPRKIMSNEQMRSLRNWVTDVSGRIKIIVTSVPPWESESSDKWHGFIDQRDELLITIADNAIEKVLFLSGDVHASMASQLDLGTVKVSSVVSSAFFWPYPHPKPRKFKLSGTINTNTGNNWRLSGKSTVVSTDSFTKLNISKSKLDMCVFDRRGNRRAQKAYQW